MIEDLVLSLAIGTVSAIILIALWAYCQYIAFSYLCKKLLQRVINCLKPEGNREVLGKLCTNEFIEAIEPIGKQVENIGPIISIDNFKFNVLNTIQNRLRMLVSFDIIHEGGQLRGQAIMYSQSQKILMHQFVILP